MSNNRMVILTLLIVSLFFISPALACYTYPPMGPGQHAGTVKGTIYASDGKTPLPGASVSIINSSNGHDYASTSTDGQGHYQFSGVNSTAGNAYKIHAAYEYGEISIDCYYSEDSQPFGVGSGCTVTIDVTIPSVKVVHDGGDSGSPDPSACPTTKPIDGKPLPPKGNHSAYPAMLPGQKPGIILGVVLSNETSQPFNNVYVAIVSAENPSIEYSAVTTDCNGFFAFYNVNSTNNKSLYKIYISDGKGKNAYSRPFAVGSTKTVQINLGLSEKDIVVEIPLGSAPTVKPSTCPTNNTTQNNTVPKLNMDSAKNKDLLSQVSQFFGSIIFGIIHF